VKKTTTPKAKSDWKKVASCLYRYRGETYYALLKVRGKQVRQSLETTDRKLAERKLRTLRASLEKTDPAIARRTLDQHRKIFDGLQTGAASTLYSRQLHTRQLIERWPEGYPTILGKITTTHLRGWLKQFDGELDSSSLNQRITTLRKFFDQAVEDKVIAENPVLPLKYKGVAKKKKSTPTEEQFRAIVADIRSQRANGHGAEDSADFVELAGTLGLGQAELTGIRRQDIDLRANQIQLFRCKMKHRFFVPIFPDARPIIERRLAVISTDPDARLLPQNNCRKAMEGACGRLGFPHFEPRSLRRYHITRCLRTGIDAPTVGAWQGHRDGGKLVLSVYQAEINNTHSQKMAAMLGPKPDNVVELPKQQSA
jgi:integrase